MSSSWALVSMQSWFGPWFTPRVSTVNHERQTDAFHGSFACVNLWVENLNRETKGENMANAGYPSSAAKRIARVHNSWVLDGWGGNGSLIFGPDGSGGLRVSVDTLGFGPDDVVVSLRRRKNTASEAQEILEEKGIG